MCLDHRQPYLAADAAPNSASDISTHNAGADPTANAPANQSTDHCVPDAGTNITPNNASDQPADLADFGQPGQLGANVVTNCKPCDDRTDPSTHTAADAGNDHVADHGLRC